MPPLTFPTFSGCCAFACLSIENVIDSVVRLIQLVVVLKYVRVIISGLLIGSCSTWSNTR